MYCTLELPGRSASNRVISTAIAGIKHVLRFGMLTLFRLVRLSVTRFHTCDLTGSVGAAAAFRPCMYLRPYAVVMFWTSC